MMYKCVSRLNRAVRKICSLVAVGLLTIVPAAASAQTITFTTSGLSGSGMIGTTSFSNANFTITSSGNVAERQSFTGGYFIDHLMASIVIDGVGSYNFITGTRTFVNNSVTSVGFSRAGSAGLDLFNGPSNAAFATWDMTTSIGAFMGTGNLVQWGSSPVLTSGGTLSFNSQQTTATFSAIVAPSTTVPEPATYVLVATGLLALGATKRRTFKR